MLIVGELINASRKEIGAAIEARDKETIQRLAVDQAEAGADYIDVNAGIFMEKEPPAPLSRLYFGGPLC